jgi:hypothetical protein
VGHLNDQAWIESFFGHLKAEHPHLERITDPGELQAELTRLRTSPPSRPQRSHTKPELPSAGNSTKISHRSDGWVFPPSTDVFSDTPRTGALARRDIVDLLPRVQMRIVPSPMTPAPRPLPTPPARTTTTTRRRSRTNPTRRVVSHPRPHNTHRPRTAPFTRQPTSSPNAYHRYAFSKPNCDSVNDPWAARIAMIRFFWQDWLSVLGNVAIFRGFG